MLRLLTAPVPSPHHPHHQRHQRHQHHHTAAASRFLNNVSFPTPATTTTTFLVSNLFVCFFLPALYSQLNHIILGAQFKGSEFQTIKGHCEWRPQQHIAQRTFLWHDTFLVSLHSELSSVVSWHKLEIDKNLFNICQLQNTLLFHSGLANYSILKGDLIAFISKCRRSYSFVRHDKMYENRIRYHGNEILL